MLYLALPNEMAAPALFKNVNRSNPSIPGVYLRRGMVDNVQSWWFQTCFKQLQTVVWAPALGDDRMVFMRA